MYMYLGSTAWRLGGVGGMEGKVGKAERVRKLLDARRFQNLARGVRKHAAPTGRTTQSEYWKGRRV